MPPRRSRAAALVAVVALLLTAPLERGRGCDVCPVGCPMHRAVTQPVRAVGCHHGQDGAPAPERHPTSHGACSMRSSCGHHGRAELVVFHLELAPVANGRPHVVARRVPRATARVPATDAPAPLEHPPESRFV